MTLKTHQSIGLFGGTLAGLISLSNPMNTFINFLIIIFSSVMPDCDLALGIKHRTVTHSLLCLTCLSLLILLVYPKATFPFIIGYGSHILADSLNPSGVPFLFPYRKTYGLKLIYTRSNIDNAIGVICLTLTAIIVFYPLTKDLINLMYM